MGKPIGIDLQEKKMTLPLIYALRESGRGEKRRIMNIVQQDDKSRSDIRTVSQFVADRGGIAYARRRMNAFAREAHAQLVDVPPSDARDALLDLVAFTVQRKK